MGTTGRGRPLPALPEEVGELGPGTQPSEALSAWLRALLAREQEGDAAASKALIEAFDAVPSLWERFTGLQEIAERSWLELLVPNAGRGFTREGLRRDLERVRREPAGPDPTPIERVLADRVALCWVAALHADTQYAQRLADGTSFKEGEFLQRRCERANRQLLRAVQTLATVRRLLAPTQINIGQNQINVAR